jgi:AcrR family transcriptional regulator
MKKTAYHHGNLKEMFLKIAFDFIKTESIERLTLKVLSDATGTSRSAIYRHFDSKDALIETMVLKSLSDFNKTIVNSLKDRNIPTRERVQQFAKNYIEFAKDNSSLYRLLFNKKYKNIRKESEIDKESGFIALKTTIEEGQKSDNFKQGDSNNYSIMLFALLHGLSSLYIDNYLSQEKISEELNIKILENIYI